MQNQVTERQHFGLVVLEAKLNSQTSKPSSTHNTVNAKISFTVFAKP